jgi:hypothetical protein
MGRALPKGGGPRLSTLTRCNYCSLREIKDRYGADKVTLRFTGDGFIQVRVEGEAEPLAWFVALTGACCC